MRTARPDRKTCLAPFAGVVAAVLTGAGNAGEVVLDNFTIGNPADDVSLALDPAANFSITEDLGRRAGSNLFHSFDSFNVDSGETALFSGDSAIVNIISRVTGGNASVIDGTIRSTIDGAGFWFINPTGLMLGPNSVIDVGSTFNIGSADIILFADDLNYSSFDDSVTLSVASPVDFGFLDAGGGAGVLTLNGTEFGGTPGAPGDERYNGIAFAGREVLFADSAVRTLGEDLARGDIIVSGNRITLNNSRLQTATSGAADAGSITVNGVNVAIDNGSVLSADSDGASATGNAGSISITAAASVTSNVGAAAGGATAQISSGSRSAPTGATGNIAIRGADILLNNADIFANSQSEAPGNAAGSILLDAQGGNLILNDTFILTDITGITDASTITLMAANVDLNGTVLSSFTDGDGPNRGDAGAISVTGTTGVTAHGTGRYGEWNINARSSTPDAGAVGDVTIQGGEITLTGGSIESTTASDLVDNEIGLIRIESEGALSLSGTELSATTSGRSGSGIVQLAGSAITLDGASLESTSLAEDAGAAGVIEINGTSSVVINMSTIATETFSDVVSNLAGWIKIETLGQMQLTGSTLAATTLGQSEAGMIDLDGLTIVLNDATIESASLAVDGGPAGIVEINGVDSVVVTDSTLATDTSSDRAANEGGWIKIETQDNLEIIRSALAAETSGQSEAGFVDLDGLTIRLDQATIRSTSETADSGAAGVIQINGISSVDISESSLKTNTASNRTENLLGTITIDSAGDVRIGHSLLEAATSGASGAGIIDLTAANIQLSANTEIAVQTTGTGEAGDIDISTVGSTVTLDDSVIQAESTSSGDGGNILMSIGTLELLNGSVISSEASGQAPNAGFSGYITITAADDVRIIASDTTFSGITTRAEQSEGGDITVAVTGQLEMDGGLIEASAGADGNGGNLYVSADNVLMQSSGLLARADDGDGGEINLTITGIEQLFVIDSESIINADSDTGTAGQININAPDVDLDSALQEQDANIVVAPELAADACSPSATGTMSTFVQEDEGGTPESPDRYLYANAGAVSTAAQAMAGLQAIARSDALLAATQNNGSESCR